MYFSRYPMDNWVIKFTVSDSCSTYPHHNLLMFSSKVAILWCVVFLVRIYILPHNVSKLVGHN